MNRIETRLPGVVIVAPRVFRDERGYFLETWNRAKYEALGLPGSFVQDNLSYSTRGVLRGLHYQHPFGQGKLVSVVRGEVFDVAVDVRVGSPDFGRWVGVTLSGEDHRAMYVPPGFAHGFVVTSDEAVFCYKCTEYYQPQSEASLAWDDPAIGIAWPVGSPTLSPKDRAAPRLSSILAERLPRYQPASSDRPDEAHALRPSGPWSRTRAASPQAGGDGS